ncbi:MAG TPA: TetR/AcrR family transcriptional regulator [Propionibacteriaceae bacterium]|nr:TetR/AcrR family transcriptional regulator [Propionibacteriaceae bacterium]
MDNRDGRDTRWEEHRVERRAALVDSTLRAIRTHGASVTVDEVAVASGTSKTVLYRYFGDRNGLYLAVADRVASNILAEVAPRFASLRDGGHVADIVRDLADAYIGLVDRDPEIYLFVMNRPAGLPAGAGDPATGIADRIAVELAEAIREEQHRRGTSGGAVETLAFGIVGFIRTATGHWLETGGSASMPRSGLIALITSTFARSVTDAVEGTTPAGFVTA